MAQTTWLFVVSLVCQTITYSNGDIATRIDTLQAEVLALRQEVTDLTGTLDTLEKTVKSNIADQKIDKTIANVLLNNQENAAMYWSEVKQFAESSALKNYIKTVIENSYLGNSDNFYFVLEFLTRNELYQGYELLLQELEEHGEVNNGQEIFALAHLIRKVCGKNNEHYLKMPKVVKDILAGPVILKNVDNNGFIMSSEESAMGCSSRETCYESPRSQVFIYRLPIGKTVNDLQTNPRAQWQFNPPSNISELSLGFYVKNMDKNFYFIFKQRVTAAFLRNNTMLEPYYARDMQAQFLPTLIPNASPEENLLRIGVREKFFRRIEYFYGAEFAKATKLDFSRRSIFKNEVKGFVFEVIPVVTENETMNNEIDTGVNGNRCKFTM